MNEVLRRTDDGYECRDCGAGMGSDPEDCRCPASLEAWKEALSAEVDEIMALQDFPRLSSIYDAPEPEAVLSAQTGTLLGAGEVGVFSGPGGAGKSSLALALALAARPGPGEHGDAGGGLTVRRGTVMLASYEDSLARIAGKARWLADQSSWGHVVVWRDPAPLWTVDGPSGSFEAWAAAAEHCSLVVVDPASVAFSGASPSDGAAVRAFLSAVSAAAAAGGAGVLIVAHDTKGARRLARGGAGPAEGAVAGSSQWSDGARAVLHLSGEIRPDVAEVACGMAAEEHRILRIAKSNYARAGAGWLIEPRYSGTRWQGLRIGTALDVGRIREADEAAGRKPPAAKPDAGNV